MNMLPAIPATRATVKDTTFADVLILLDLIRNAEQYSERIEEFKSTQADALAYAGDLNRLKRADELLSEAEEAIKKSQAESERSATLAKEAEQRATEIVDGAKQEAHSILQEINAKRTVQLQEMEQARSAAEQALEDARGDRQQATEQLKRAKATRAEVESKERELQNKLAKVAEVMKQ